jgi:hypothetical protein
VSWLNRTENAKRAKNATGAKEFEQAFVPRSGCMSGSLRFPLQLLRLLRHLAVFGSSRAEQ